ncbi:hypothetical protein AQUCO_01100407v1 [Aquilegia coerulea]|uniref:Cytochrome P450 n=1 Tax=Aquilegia coerulea TaxID=218851 RepID=A0A2G5E707_AQUCA|nr:hypothetical protein AQUCO_01100407v1 [Aquilegia coerulea]
MDISVPARLQWFENQQAILVHHPLSLPLLFFSLFFLLCFNRVWPAKATNLPPSPPKLPIIGHLHCLGTLPHRSLQALSEKYGPLMLLQLGQTPALVVSSAAMAKQIMKTHDIIFANRPITTASKLFLYGCKDITFAPYGEYWRQMRKICILDLLSVKRVQSFSFVRKEEIANMVNDIKQSCSLGRKINLSGLIVSATNNIISRVALGRSWGTEYAELTTQVMDLFGILSMEDVFPSLGWIDVLTGLHRKMKKTSKTMHQFVDEVIEEHVLGRNDDNRKADQKDFVDILLDYEEDPTPTFEFTRENLKAVIIDMFVAGTDTIYTTLEWAMAELVNHPNEMKILQEEIHRVVGDKSEVDENEISQMDYLSCVIKETLRLHPPLVMVIPRVSSARSDIDGYNIPANTRVIINAWAIARDPKIWDKPNEFIPGRFIKNKVDFRGQDFEFIPFGAGRRGCPGISFGITSIESILASLLYWFDWESPSGNTNEKIDMSEAFGLSVHMKSPLNLVPKFRT